MTPAFPAIPAGHARFAGALRSEWTKLSTVRSTRWLLLALIIATAAIGAGVSAAEATGVAHSAARKAAFDPANWSLAVLGFTQFFFGILGVLAISGEYTSGTIRSSLAAVPRRLRLLAAKITVIGLAALLAGEATTMAMFFAGQALLRSAGAPFTTLGQHRVRHHLPAQRHRHRRLRGSSLRLVPRPRPVRTASGQIHAGDHAPQLGQRRPLQRGKRLPATRLGQRHADGLLYRRGPHPRRRPVRPARRMIQDRRYPCHTHTAAHSVRRSALSRTHITRLRPVFRLSRRSRTSGGPAAGTTGR